MATTQEVKFALEFPQGLIVFMKGAGDSVNGVYFNPSKSSDAFMLYGERKELFGKNAVTVSQNRETGAGGYSVVYEFSPDGALYDARLVKDGQTLRGTLANNQTVQGLNDALAQGTLKLYSPQDTQPASVLNAARLADGRILVQLANKRELYLGKDGNFQKLDAKLAVQGGSSMYYRMSTGESIELPWGFGGPNHEIPKFNGVEMAYLDLKSRDPAQLGLIIPAGVTHLDPFSPQLAPKAPPSPKAAMPKPPGR